MKKKPSSEKKVFIFESIHTLTNYLFKTWIQIAQEAIKEKGNFCVALSGGRTPIDFFCRLSELKEFDLWSKTHIFQSDERFVPADDENSNLRMIKENLLNYVPIPPDNIHPIDTNQTYVFIAGECYEKDMRDFFRLGRKNIPRFDLILLGIGEDGHVASLFPHDDALKETSRLSVGVLSHYAKHQRVTLTLPVINHAAHIFLLVTGSHKAGIVKNIIEEKGDFPAAKVHPTSGELLYLLDHAASKELILKGAYRNFDEGVLVSL